jgi:glycosyltransferase involved in cell wall biosynthesis
MRLPVVAAVNLLIEGRELKTLGWCFRRPHVRLVTFSSRYASAIFPAIDAKTAILANWVSTAYLDAPSKRESARSDLRIGNEDVAIGVVGRVSRARGQRLFLDSGIPLLREFPNLRLCICGGPDSEDSNEESELKALAGPYGDRILFADRSTPIAFLDAMDIAVVPSIRHEASALVAKECMARSLPVIATNRGALVEAIEHGNTGRVVEAEQGPMRRAMLELTSDPAARSAMGRAGRVRAETEFSPDVLIPKAMASILGAAA